MTGMLARMFAAHLRATHVGAEHEAGTAMTVFAAALRAAGHELEGVHLLESGWVRSERGEWSRRLYVSRHAPSDAVTGDIWLDSLEVMPMLRIELPPQGSARPSRASWMALRPVHRWQLMAFIAAAPLAHRAVQVEPHIHSFDAARLGGDEKLPATRMTFGEATLYAHAFGKSLAGVREWHGARAFLGARLDALWRPGVHEFTGYGAQEEERLRSCATNWERDPYVSPDEEDAIVVDELFESADTGFRTCGDGTLLPDPTTNLPSCEPIALARSFPR